MRRIIRQHATARGKLDERFPEHHRRMKQSSSVEAFYALVFAACVLIALLMLVG
jgi:hypothetical protein